MNAEVLPLFAVLPLTAAALSVLVHRPLLDRLLMVGVPLATTAGGTWLVSTHGTAPVLAHHVGGFVPGVAIPFVSDTFSAVMLTVTGLATAAAAAHLALTGEARYRFLPPLVLMLHAGVNGALLTGDLFNLFVFVEVMLLPSYALIAMTGSWRRLGVGRTFALVNLLTSTLLLIGVGLVYASAGTVNLAALEGQAQADSRVGLAVSLVLFALAVKAAVMPVHGWLPRTYPFTSAGIMALFAGVHTKVAVYALYRVYAMCCGGQPAPWAAVLAVVVIATMALGALGTFGEARMRSALAWQMISGVGHILVGIAVLTGFAVGAGLFYLVHHVMTMSALLLAAGAIEETYGSGRFDRLSGLARREPAVAAMTALGLLSLVGLPPMSGLWGKVGLVASIAQDLDPWRWTLLGAVVLSSVVALMALQRLWGQVFWGPPMQHFSPFAASGDGQTVALTDDVRIPWRLLVPAGVLTVVSVLMFLGVGALVPVMGSAADGLLDTAAYRQAVLP